MNWTKLNRDASNCHFGYYDRNPWSADMSKHLALRSDVQDHVPKAGEKAEVGYIERASRKFAACAETRAWCHQQGSMTQWLGHLKDAFVFNDYDEAEGKLVARAFQIGKGFAGRYERPVYIVSPNGRWGLSLDFSRLPRRGYSYADVPLPLDKPQPDLDANGLFLIDMLSGETKLLLSYRQIVARHPLAFSLDSRHWWLDHPGFNCDSTKILFLFRDCADPLNPSPWRTDMFTCDLDGGNLACSLPDIYWRNMVSHQLWGRTPSEIVVDANWRGEGHEYLVFDMRDLPPLAKRISRGMGPMAHLVFSPDGKWLLADTYPDKRKIQRLAVVEAATGRLALLREFKHPQPDGFPIDLRCDLHPRWSRDGSVVTVDSIDDGTRGIYMLDFKPELLF